MAGLGSRFLPATKANPKEMLPVVDKPLIQYAVEEAVRAGITHMIFITSSSKRAIEDHFDSNFELEMHLQAQGKQHSLNLLKNISPGNIHFTYVRQNKPLGLGHAVLCSEPVVGNEPFAVLLADDLIDDIIFPCLSAMTKHFAETGNSIIGVQSVLWTKIHQYGVVKVDQFRENFAAILSVIEKPSRALAPSNLAAVGRYIFTPAIFSCLRQIDIGFGNEVQLTDGIQSLLKQQVVDAYQFIGKRYDCGSKLGYLQATIEFAMRHTEIGEAFIDFLSELKDLKEKA